MRKPEFYSSPSFFASLIGPPNNEPRHFPSVSRHLPSSPVNFPSRPVISQHVPSCPVIPLSYHIMLVTYFCKTSNRKVDYRAENDNLSASYSKFSRNSNPRNQYQHDSYKKSFKQQPSFQKQRSQILPNNLNQSKALRLKTCKACKMLNLRFVGHNIHSCRNVSPMTEQMC